MMCNHNFVSLDIFFKTHNLIYYKIDHNELIIMCFV